MENGFTINEINELFQDLQYISDSKIFEKELKSLLRKEGLELKKQTVREAKLKVKKRTGEYIKGIKRGKPYKYKQSDLSIRVYNSKPHAHLIEHGHNKVTKNGEVIGWVDGYDIFKNSQKSFSNKYPRHVKKFIDDFLRGKNL